MDIQAANQISERQSSPTNDDDEATESADSTVGAEEDNSLDAASTPIQVWGESELEETRNRTRSGRLPQRNAPVMNSSLVRPEILELRKTTCSVCGELLPSVPELESHMFAHGLYLCNTCLRCFKYKRSFENHTFICKDLHRNQLQGVTFESLLNGRGFFMGDKEREHENEYVLEEEKDNFGNFSERGGKRSSARQDNKSGRRRTRFSGYGLERLPRPSLIPVPPSSKSPPPDVKDTTEVVSAACDLQTLALAAAAMTPHSLADSEQRTQRKNLPSDTESKEPTLNPHPPHSSFHIPFHSQVFMPSPMMGNGDMDPKHPTLVWQGIQIQSEQPLVVQLEGFNPVTEQRYVLYRCCLCGQSYPSVSMLASHLTAHCRSGKEPICEKCGAIFKWRSQLEVHEQVHQVIDNSMSSNMQPSNFMMMNSTMMEKECQGHSPILHQQLMSPGTFMSGLQEKEDPKMGLLTESGNFMKPPQRRRRRFESRFTNFNCKYCPKTFDRLFSLQRHERVHTGVKPCFCKQCGRGFSERRNLRHHIIRFHSDNNQREAFRRQRRNKARGQNSSLKLVSFLKKTAVRILNSMDQTRGDQDSPPPFPLNEKENSRTCREEDSVRDDRYEVESRMMVEERTPEAKSEEKVVEERPEVLLDPKRSLIGSRRKGRPFKYASSAHLIPVNDRQETTPEGPPTVVVKEEVDSDDGHAYTEMLQVALSEDGSIPPESLPTFKAKLRGHGSFFSSYNPRLGVVNKPISRMEACRPQLGDDGKCVYPCSYCFKTFCSTSDLNRHMDFHEDVRPFKCPYCNYHSRTNSQLKVHMMRHQGIKQYLCTTCNYNGVTQSDLNRHMKTRTHILRTRNICVCCGLGFYTRSLLEEHQRMFNHSIATAAAAAAVACDFKSLGLSGFPLMGVNKAACNVPVPDIPIESQSVSV